AGPGLRALRRPAGRDVDRGGAPRRQGDQARDHPAGIERTTLMDKRVALIPGGAKGIGREIALRLAERGWSVALCYRTSVAEADNTRTMIEKRGARALAVCADVSSTVACEELVQHVTGWGGRIDALINAA